MKRTGKDLNTLLEGLKEGKESDFKELFDCYFPHLVYYACRFTDKDKAEDIVQDVFVWVWLNRDNIEFGKSFMSFLRQSVYNKAINHIKREKMIQTHHAAIEISEKAIEYFADDDVLEKIANEEKYSKINNAIDQLPEQPKICLKMSYIQGMKASEIAEILDLSPRTVETHLYNGLKALRKSLKIICVFF